MSGINENKNYFDIHVKYGFDDGDGYSIFIETNSNASEQDAIEKAKKENLFEDPEDILMIDKVTRIDRDEFLLAKNN